MTGAVVIHLYPLYILKMAAVFAVCGFACVFLLGWAGNRGGEPAVFAMLFGFGLAGAIANIGNWLPFATSMVLLLIGAWKLRRFRSKGVRCPCGCGEIIITMEHPPHG